MTAVFFFLGMLVSLGAPVSAATAILIGKITIGIIASFVLSKVSSLLAPRPKFGPFDNSRQVTTRQDNAPWQVIYGTRGRVPGIVTDMHLTGSAAEYLNLLITVACHELGTFGNLNFDGVNVPLDGSGNATGTFAGNVHCEKNVGTDDQARLSGLSSEDGAHWPSTFRQRGHAHAWVRLKHSPDKFANGVPNITFDVVGRKCRDPRSSGSIAATSNAALIMADYLTDLKFGPKFLKKLDLSAATITHSGMTVFDATKVANGNLTDTAFGTDSASSGSFIKVDLGASGAAEPWWFGVYALAAGSPASFKIRGSNDDSSYTDVQEWNLLPDEIGWKWVRLIPKGTFRYWKIELTNTPGAGAEFGELRFWLPKLNRAQLIVAADICDEDVSLAGGGTQDKYTIDGMFTVDTDWVAVVRSMGEAMLGLPIYINGEWHIKPGKYESPTISLDESDLRGGIEVVTAKSRTELFNAVRGQYLSSANNWQRADFPAYRSNTYIEQDQGRILYHDVEFPFTTSSPAAQRMSKALVEIARRRPFRGQFKLTAWSVQAGDTVQFSFARYGWVNKTFLVTSARLVQEVPEGEGGGEESPVPIMGVDLELLEWDSNVFAWSAEEATAAAVASGTLPSQTLSAAEADQAHKLAQTGSRSEGPTTDPLTAADVGGDTTISIASHTWRARGLGDKTHNSGSIIGVPFSQATYVYTDDATLLGGTLTYVGSTSRFAAMSGGQRKNIGSLTTPADGAGGTSGGGDGGIIPPFVE